MKRLTTNKPKGMTENMLNMVFGKNNEVYLRGLGENQEDISLVEYCKKEYNRLYDDSLDDTWTAENFGELMDDDSLLSIMYWACVGFCEVRARLEVYEDESEKIRTACTKPCHMGKDIKLIKREYKEGHEPYGQILAQYECQLKTCPKICSAYKHITN
jgi:hypothetical protein